MDFSKDSMPSVVKKQTDDGWSIVTFNLGGVPVVDRHFASDADADAFLLEQQALIEQGKVP